MPPVAPLRYWQQDFVWLRWSLPADGPMTTVALVTGERDK